MSRTMALCLCLILLWINPNQSVTYSPVYDQKELQRKVTDHNEARQLFAANMNAAQPPIEDLSHYKFATIMGDSADERYKELQLLLRYVAAFASYNVAYAVGLKVKSPKHHLNFQNSAGQLLDFEGYELFKEEFCSLRSQSSEDTKSNKAEYKDIYYIKNSHNKDGKLLYVTNNDQISFFNVVKEFRITDAANNALEIELTQAKPPKLISKHQTQITKPKPKYFENFNFWSYVEETGYFMVDLVLFNGGLFAYPTDVKLHVDVQDHIFSLEKEASVQLQVEIKKHLHHKRSSPLQYFKTPGVYEIVYIRPVYYDMKKYQIHDYQIWYIAHGDHQPRSFTAYKPDLSTEDDGNLNWMYYNEMEKALRKDRFSVLESPNSGLIFNEFIIPDIKSKSSTNLQKHKGLVLFESRNQEHLVFFYDGDTKHAQHYWNVHKNNFEKSFSKLDKRIWNIGKDCAIKWSELNRADVSTAADLLLADHDNFGQLQLTWTNPTKHMWRHQHIQMLDDVHRVYELKYNQKRIYLYLSGHHAPDMLIQDIGYQMDHYNPDVVLIESDMFRLNPKIDGPDMMRTVKWAKDQNPPKKLIVADLMTYLYSPWIFNLVGAEQFYDTLLIALRNFIMVQTINCAVAKYPTKNKFWITIGAFHYSLPIEKTVGNAGEYTTTTTMKQLLTVPPTSNILQKQGEHYFDINWEYFWQHVTMPVLIK